MVEGVLPSKFLAWSLLIK